MIHRENVRRFREHVQATLREGTPLDELVEHLIEDAVSMDIGKADAVAIIEQVNSEERTGGRAVIRLWYDADRAGSGVAFGNTILAFRVANGVERAIRRVAITVQHPLTKELVALPVITTINKGSVKPTETDLVLERVGRHSIRAGWVEVQMLNGADLIFRFEDVVPLNAENHDVARAQIQSITQTIQTYGGGVVSAGSPVDGEPRAGAAPRWVELPLAWSSLEAFREAQQEALALATTRQPRTQPDPEASAPVGLVPLSPSHLLAVPSSPTSVLLTWTDNATDEQGTHVERSSDGVLFTRMATLGPETVSYLATGLAPGSRCAFRVRAFNAHGFSDYSNVAAVVLPDDPKGQTGGATLTPTVMIPSIATPVSTTAQDAPAVPAPRPAPEPEHRDFPPSGGGFTKPAPGAAPGKSTSTNWVGALGIASVVIALVANFDWGGSGDQESGIEPVASSEAPKVSASPSTVWPPAPPTSRPTIEAAAPPSDPSPAATVPNADANGGMSGTIDWDAAPGYTVILSSELDLNRSNALVRTAQSAGIDAGLLWSSDYSSLRPGYWVVYSGRFTAWKDAVAYQRVLRSRGYKSAYARYVKQ